MWDSKAYHKKYRLDHSNQIREYRFKHKDQLLIDRKRRYKEMREDPIKLQEFRDKQKMYKRNTKNKFFDMYGNKCSCCGETEKLFLTLDHMYNNSSEIEKQQGYKDTTKEYLKAIKEYKPDTYQVLCMNCNLGKSRNGGIFPHKSKLVRKLECGKII